MQLLKRIALILGVVSLGIWSVPPATPPAPGLQVPPTTWAGMQPSVEQKLLMWDQAYWNLEINNQQHAALNLISYFMTKAEHQDLKRELSFFVRTSQRHYLLSSVVLALDPNISNATTRYSVLSDMLKTIQSIGSGVISADVATALQSYDQSGIEQDPNASWVLKKIVTSL